MSTAGMTTGTYLHRLIDEAFPVLRTGRPDDSWLADIREKGRADALTLPLPNRKQEAWRYTPVGFLEQTRYRALTDGPFDPLQLSDLDDLLLRGGSGPRLVFVNGYLAPRLSELSQNQRGIALSSLSGGLGPVRQALRSRMGDSSRHADVFMALNSALMTDGALIRVAGDCMADTPIEILHVTVSGEEPGICHPRHLVVIEEGARAEVIERYCSLGSGGVFTNAKIDVSLGAGSTLKHQRLLEEGTFDPTGIFPVNVSGGSLGMGDLMDATGLMRAMEAVLQLRGEAGQHQLEDVEVGLVQSWRRVPTTSGAVAVLSN